MNSTIRVNGANFHVQDSGDGEPALVFLHYFGGSSRSWTEVIAGLSGKHRCIAPDLRGFGDSDATPNGYSVEESADDIAALIGVLGLQQYILVGHSMGGKIALALATRGSIGMAGLILLAPSPPSPEPMPEEDRTRLLNAHGNRAAMEETISQITATPLPAPVFERTLEDNLKSSRPAWQAWLKSGSRESIEARMPSIKIPVLIVGGGEDKAMTPALLQREIADKLPDVQSHVIPDAGHLLPLEKPQEVILLISKMIVYNRLSDNTVL